MECVECSLKMHVMRYFWFCSAYQLNATSYLYENAPQYPHPYLLSVTPLSVLFAYSKSKDIVACAEVICSLCTVVHTAS